MNAFDLNEWAQGSFNYKGRIIPVRSMFLKFQESKDQIAADIEQMYEELDQFRRKNPNMENLSLKKQARIERIEMMISMYEMMLAYANHTAAQKQAKYTTGHGDLYHNIITKPATDFRSLAHLIRPKGR